MVKLEDLHMGLELLSSEEFKNFIATKQNIDPDDFYIQNIELNMYGGLKVIYSSCLNDCESNHITIFEEAWEEFLEYYKKENE